KELEEKGKEKGKETGDKELNNDESEKEDRVRGKGNKREIKRKFIENESASEDETDSQQKEIGMKIEKLGRKGKEKLKPRPIKKNRITLPEEIGEDEKMESEM